MSADGGPLDGDGSLAVVIPVGERLGILRSRRDEVEKEGLELAKLTFARFSRTMRLPGDQAARSDCLSMIRYTARTCDIQ